jgi:GlpG protein
LSAVGAGPWCHCVVLILLRTCPPATIRRTCRRVPEAMRTLSLARYMPVTLVLIAISSLITLLSSFGENRQLLLPFYISEYTGGAMREVFQGEVWRLWMPIFMHFGLFHFLFSMLWLFDLGGTLERAQGSPRLGLLVAVTGVIGNVAQYFWAGPNFGGMSGVTYGLFGYILVQRRSNPDGGLVLHPYIVVMMLAWFVLCWAGVIGNATNMAHTLCLVCGILLGRVMSPRKSRHSEQEL